MGKINRISLFLTLMFLTLVAVGCSSDGGASKDGDTIVLRASSGLPSDHIYEEVLSKPWMEKVEKESNGRVKFDYYNNAELVDLGGELDALKAGTIDVGLPIMHLYEPNLFPLSEITMVPLTRSDVQIANDAYYNLLNSDRELEDGKTFYELEIEANGLKAWPAPAGYSYGINTTGKKFNSQEDFKNTKFRISSRTNEMFVTNLGASPINMSMNDTYDALSRGALDGTIMAVADWTTWGFQDQLAYAIEGAHIGYHNSIFGMTEETWNSLPEDIQEIMENAAQDLFKTDNTIQLIEDRIDEEREKVSDDAEFEKLDELNTKTRDHIVKAMDQTWQQWIDLIEKQGDAGKEVAKLWRDLIIEAGGDVPAQIRELE